PRGGAVVGGAGLDGLDASGKGAAGAVEGTVADLEFDDVFALGLEATGHGEDVERGFGGQAAGEVAEGGVAHSRSQESEVRSQKPAASTDSKPILDWLLTPGP